MTSGLALWYDMSDTGNMLTDKSGNGNTGKVYGPAYLQLPTGAGSRVFDGSNDYVSIRNKGSLNPVSGITLEILMKVDSANKQQTLVGKGSSGSIGSGYTLSIDSGNHLQFVVYDRDGRKQTVVSNQTLAAGKWYDVVATHDGSTINIFMDGAMTASGSCAGMKKSNFGLTIGRYALASSEYFDGSLAKVRIYSRALTLQEVIQNRQTDMWRIG